MAKQTHGLVAAKKSDLFAQHLKNIFTSNNNIPIQNNPIKTPLNNLNKRQTPTKLTSPNEIKEKNS